MEQSVKSMVMVMVMVILNIVAAQVSPPGPPGAATSSPCMNAYTALLPCMSYVTGANMTVMPACCNAFVAVVLNNGGSCLCQFLSARNPLGILVNVSQSLSLPSACNINTPSLATQCSAIGIPLNPRTPKTGAPAGKASAPAPTVTVPGLRIPGPGRLQPPGMPSVSPAAGNPRPGNGFGSPDGSSADSPFAAPSGEVSTGGNGPSSSPTTASSASSSGVSPHKFCGIAGFSAVAFLGLLFAM